MNSTEACAVSGNDDLRGKSGQGIAGLSKERFKGWPIEMEATKNSVNVVHPCQLLEIAHDIHNACVATSCHHYQALILHIDVEFIRKTTPPGLSARNQNWSILSSR